MIIRLEYTRITIQCLREKSALKSENVVIFEEFCAGVRWPGWIMKIGHARRLNEIQQNKRVPSDLQPRVDGHHVARKLRSIRHTAHHRLGVTHNCWQTRHKFQSSR